MYRISKKERKKADLYKHLHNGYRFAVIQSGKILKCYRYENDAKRNAMSWQEIRSLSSMIAELDDTEN